MPASAQVASFSSPNGIAEECRVLPHIPGGTYSARDAEEEQAYCAVDFYNTARIALCPKTWSTSPGTMIYNITASGLSQQQYEAQPSCGGSTDGHSTITKFKQTINQPGTSGTFSPASLLYYHFSRYFETSVDVPVAVYRSMDKEAHLARVTRRASAGNMGKSAMNKAGWQWLYRAERNPATYKPTRELFTDDQRQIYGVLVAGRGERYGAEINGIRSKWGDAQNIDFQNTPAFLALRSVRPLGEAIREGLQLGEKDPVIAKAMGGGASDLQMAMWMKELSEITLLDYIFSQQDRVGNIDYKWYLYSVDHDGAIGSQKLDTNVPRSSMKTIRLPEVNGTADLLQRTELNDNDAGGRAYVNYAKRTTMLQKIHHVNAGTYRKLIALRDDLQRKGELFQYVQSNFNLDGQQLAQLTANASEAASILQATCRAGQLHFDLHSVTEWLRGSARDAQVDCERPGDSPGLEAASLNGSSTSELASSNGRE